MKKKFTNLIFLISVILVITFFLSKLHFVFFVKMGLFKLFLLLAASVLLIDYGINKVLGRKSTFVPNSKNSLENVRDSIEEIASSNSCAKCNKNLSSSWKVCPECGTKVKKNKRKSILT